MEILCGPLFPVHDCFIFIKFWNYVIAMRVSFSLVFVQNFFFLFCEFVIKKYEERIKVVVNFYFLCWHSRSTPGGGALRLNFHPLSDDAFAL